MVKKTRDDRNDSSGQRSPGSPPTDATPFGVYGFYLEFYVKDFTRTRLVVKRRATSVVVWSAILTAVTGLVGALISLSGLAWLGIITVASSAAVTALATWDSHFRHRELWAQRSGILNELQAMQRDYALAIATKRTSEEDARSGLEKLGALLSQDLTSWLELRKRVGDSTGPKREA
jgi:hypothetical protein